MCGVAGILSLAARAEVEQSARKMQGALLHRGPDDRGLTMLSAGAWTIALVHTRLAILDLSAQGHQPMPGEQQNCWITYNGEIYSFRELRAELPERSFRSNSDTEVLLGAYERWGLEGFARLRGMYAFGLWDSRRETLTIARDPLGIKPLYYYRTTDTLVFASEIRALLASGMAPQRISGAGVASFLGSGALEAPLTIVDGVFSVMPGEAIQIKPAGRCFDVTRGSFGGELFEPRETAWPDRTRAVEALRAALEDSVRHHLISDVAVGAFLSGGIDSSAVVALASRQAAAPLRTFAIGFEEAEFSELAHARLVAERFRTEHREIMLSEAGILDLLPGALGGMDQPSMDGVNTFAISKAVKESGITVALSGLGGDELFAGYRSFARAAHMRKLRRLPRPLRRAAAAVGKSALPDSVRLSKVWALLESECRPGSAYRLSRQLFSPEERQQLSSEAWEPESIAGGNSWTDPVNAVSVDELRGYMANTLLRDSDSMSMAHALEIRVPFVDKVLVRHVLDLPGDWKLDPVRPKPLLLEALNGLLPPEIWQRPKMGFVLPFERWMQSALRPDLERTFANVEVWRSLGLDHAAVTAAWHRFLADPRQQTWGRPWALYALSKWCERHQITQ